MTSKVYQYNHKIRSLLQDKDLDGLIEVLRHPANAAWRIQAAQALAELGNVDAAESLMRALLEDPDPAVQTAARQTLQQLLGSQTEMALAVHRSGPPSQEPWLIAPQEEIENRESQEEELDAEDDQWEDPGEESDEEDVREDLSDVEIDSFIRIALYEANVSTRLRAIHALADSNNLQATYALARLALWGDTRILRNAARYALEKRYGDQTEEILSSYQNNDSEESNDASEEQFEDEEFDSDEEAEENPDERILKTEILEAKEEKYPRVKTTQGEAVVEDMGTPRWLVLLGILAALVMVALLLQPR